MSELSLVRQADEEREAQRYAKLISRPRNVDWVAVNRTLIRRYSKTALRRIKVRAWAIIGERAAEKLR